MMDLRIYIHKCMNPKDRVQMRKRANELSADKGIFDQPGFSFKLQTKETIKNMIEANKRAYVQKLMEKGVRMEGSRGVFNEQELKKLKEDYLFKLINIVHQR